MDRLKVLAAMSQIAEASCNILRAGLSALEAESAKRVLKEELNRGEEDNE